MLGTTRCSKSVSRLAAHRAFRLYKERYNMYFNFKRFNCEVSINLTPAVVIMLFVALS
jgi:hypothetical protein